MDGDELATGIMIGMFIGVGIAMAVFLLIGTSEPSQEYITLSADTANDLCIKITGNDSAIAKDWYDYGRGRKPIEKGGLVCELPSYDSTHNIVIRQNG